MPINTPPITSLPAGETIKDDFSTIGRIGSVASRSGSRQPQRPQQQEFNQSVQMLENQRKKELNDVTRWFDVQAAILDQGQLDPDKHRAAYTRLQQQAATQRTEAQAKYTAYAQQIKTMQGLVERRTMQPEQMQQTMLVMAGFSVGDVQRWATTKKQREGKQKPMAQLRDLKYQADRIEAFRDRFVDDRTDVFGKGLWRKNPKTEKRTDIRAKEEERQAYDNAGAQLYNIQTEMIEVFDLLSPLEKDAQAGSRAIDRFGGGRKPPLSGRRQALGFGGFGSMGVAPPTPVSKKQPTREELMKQKTKKAYKQGKQLGYWE